MRQLKFRAWNKELNIMRNNSTIDCYNSELNRSFKENLMLTMDGEIRVCQWYGDRVSMREDNNYKLMQFTGLQDKNGVNIYEGDVIKIHYVGSPVVGSVEFFQKRDYEDGKWAIRHTGWILADFKRKTGKEACEMGFHFSIKELREVIGNIYQNPELLTDNN